MTSDVRVAAIIVTHNRPELLRRSVRSVLRQRPSAPPLIVVDNGSTDHTSQVLQDECPHATVIRLAENVGCVAARNIAAAAATSEVLFFLDDDSEVTVDAVAAATRIMLADERIGAVIGTIVEHGTPIRVTNTPSRTFINVCHGQGAFRKNAFAAVGMYPRDFRYGAEEMDLSLRFLEAGYHIVFDPGIVLFHAVDPHPGRRFGDLEVHRNMLRIVLMRAPLVLLVPWALKKLSDTVTAALRTRRPAVIAGEFLALPRTVLRSVWHRRAISWEVFAAWRYLGTREVTSRDYRAAALVEYPSRWDLLFGYLQNPSTPLNRRSES